MNVISTEAYQRAFSRYIRTGAPIRYSLKSDRSTPQYVWRTRGDWRVRPEHAAGGGAGVTLSEIGHLRDIVEQYAYYSDGEGAHRRLTDQITNEARARGQGEFAYDFNGSYQFEYASWPETAAHGRAVVEGVFVGRVTDHGAFLAIRGEIQFRFTDMFTDPTDIRDLLAAIREAPSATRELLNDLAEMAGIGDDEAYQAIDVLPDDVPAWFLRLTEVGGIAYPISGVWRSEFTAEVVKR